MDLPGDLGQLTYCQNIHPAQSWEEARAALLGPTRVVKAALSPDAPFAVGLRFSAETVAALGDPAARAELKRILAEEGYDPITVNGFPYGPFHGVRVKEEVYLPDWRSAERLDYTTRLIDLMAEIATGPDSRIQTLSTVPGAFKPNGIGAEIEIAEGLLRAAAHCVEARRRTGRTVAIAIEPEPFCLLETTAEAVGFFERRLFSAAAAARLAALADLPTGEAQEALRRHLGLCYDVCHQAVEFEDPVESVGALRGAGVPVHKLQLSAALRCPRIDAEIRAALAPFAEPTYLHQVVSRGHDGALARVSDLPEALARGAASDSEEWRIHFHVPIFVDAIPPFESTQSVLLDILALHADQPIAPHLEVETYTWDVLPEAMRREPVEASIARELSWVRERLA